MTTRLERLQQDINDLEQYIQRLKRKGNVSAVQKMTKKMTYLQSYVAENQLSMQ